MPEERDVHHHVVAKDAVNAPNGPTDAMTCGMSDGMLARMIAADPLRTTEANPRRSAYGLQIDATTIWTKDLASIRTYVNMTILIIQMSGMIYWTWRRTLTPRANLLTDFLPKYGKDIATQKR